MSRLIVEVCRVDNVEKHANADRMCVCTVKGWKVCSGVDPVTGDFNFSTGDKCVYFPPDAVLPQELADRLGVTKYLSPLPSSRITGQRPPGGRVRVARLRGFPSYGLIMKPDDPEWPIGMDVAELLGITKWEPPTERTDGDAERPHPAFHRYFDIENWRNFPDVFQEGEEVAITEKIHGMNGRLGRIRCQDDAGCSSFVLMAGSHDVRRKEFSTVTKKHFNKETNEDEVIKSEKRCGFWEVLSDPIKELMEDLGGADPLTGHNVVVFGEVFGSGVQDMAYGLDNGKFDFRVFDITVDGRYLDAAAKTSVCAGHGVPMVPFLFCGPFNRQVVEQLVSGPTMLCAPEMAGKFKGREGIVITSVKERTVVTDKAVFDRAVFKVVSFDYLERKGGTENH